MSPPLLLVVLWCVATLAAVDGQGSAPVWPRQLASGETFGALRQAPQVVSCSADRDTELATGWHVSPAEGNARDIPGDQVSRADFDGAGAWLPVKQFPATVLGVFLQNELYPFDLNQDRNLERVALETFNKPYWYRVSFRVESPRRPRLLGLLRFFGVNYRAEVYLNGRRLAGSDQVVGTFRQFDLEAELLRDAENTLAVRVWRPENRALTIGRNDSDLAMSFIDWSPEPPDQNMGVWQRVSIGCLQQPDAAHGADEYLVRLDHPRVVTEFVPRRAADQQGHNPGAAQQTMPPPPPHLQPELPPLLDPVTGEPARAPVQPGIASWARLAIHAEVRNHDPRLSQKVVVRASLRPALPGEVEVTLVLRPGQSQTVSFTPVSHPRELDRLDPTALALWWPHQMGSASLHTLTLEAAVVPAGGGDPVVGHRIQRRVGLRTMQDRLIQTSSGRHRLFFVNGYPVLINGAGWSPDLHQRQVTNHEDVARQFALVRHLGLNTIRLEGNFEDAYWFGLADRMGLLVMPGWSCCDSWQRWSLWGDEQFRVANASLRDQMLRLAAHPCVVNFYLSSDELPPRAVEAQQLEVARLALWPNPTLSAAAKVRSPLSGESGVKMSGPYAYTPPNYWTQAALRGLLGGAFGFLTEGGPGAAPMLWESFDRATERPGDSYWPVLGDSADPVWRYTCAHPSGVFRDLRFFGPPLEQRFGAPAGVREFLYTAQLTNFESHRAMFEAYAIRKYSAASSGAATGVVHWMLNSPRPQHMWRLYDWYLGTGGSYYGVHAALGLPSDLPGLVIDGRVASDLAGGVRFLRLAYDYLDDTVYGLNAGYHHTFGGAAGMPIAVRARASLLTDDATALWDSGVQMVSERLGPDSSRRLLRIPGDAIRAQAAAQGRSAWVLRLWLYAGDGQLLPLARSEYLLSTQADEYDWPASNFYRTPQTAFANYTDARLLPRIPSLQITGVRRLEASEADRLVRLAGLESVLAAADTGLPHEPEGLAWRALELAVANPNGRGLAFGVSLRLEVSRAPAGGDQPSWETVPGTMWSSNWFSLGEGESRRVFALWLAQGDDSGLTYRPMCEVSNNHLAHN